MNFSKRREYTTIQLRPSLLLVTMMLWSAPTLVRAEVPTAASGPRVVLGQAMQLYVQGQYEAATQKLRPLLEAQALSDPSDQRTALKTYGTALFLSGRRAAAERAFRDLLRRWPNAALDRGFVHPTVVRFFDLLRRKYHGELNRVVRRSAPTRSAVVNLLPPWGQLQNGHLTKAKVLGAVEAVLTVASIATAATLYGLRSKTGEFDNPSLAEGLQAGNYVSFGLLAATLVYGVVDGLHYYFADRRAKLSEVAWGRSRPMSVLVRF